MLDNLAVVLVKTKFSENVGSVVRACLNMGCSEIILVEPWNWDPDKAAPLATAKGLELLSKVQVFPNLEEALKPFNPVVASTARTGGWRKGILTPVQAAALVVPEIRNGARAALVFGPEDRGLTNEEVSLCSRIVTIPTDSEGTSLNLSQAVLVVLYECFKAYMEKPIKPRHHPMDGNIGHDEFELLINNVREALSEIDYLKPDNQDYWMLPARRFLNRVGIKRNEFNLLMGVCRQIKWAMRKKDDSEGN